jgi:hypothetical protein
MAHVVKCLVSKPEALSSNPSTTPPQKKKENENYAYQKFVSTKRKGRASY